MIDKSIYNNSRKQEIINKKKKNPILFISKSLHNISNSKTNSHHFYDLSAISQAYVFYKLSQIQVSNSYKLRSVLHYQGIPFFPKLEIKDYFETRGVVHSKLGDKKLPSYEMNQWKNWLREHYQYNLSQIKWSRLIPEKWRNALHKHHIAKIRLYDRIRLVYLDEMGGIAIPMPKIFTMFSSFSMASLALPGMSGFVAELIVFFGLITSQKYLLMTKALITFVMAIGMILTPIYLLSMLRQMFYGYKIFNISNSYFSDSGKIKIKNIG
ncbi:hypothetical protein CASFOL_007846 [Castilleja foliolosa]|uniref:Uncharacterized protein n=1 Tax=Castilleja foliolosa TaxID=1961234 RepID=A0ABD3E329_9LAMI